mgnify:CR=1 FL=1|jgi:Transcriptional regulators
MAVNQRQIAEALNLSIITVSRALRGHPDLAESTKARVLQKAHELGYRKFATRPDWVGGNGGAATRRIGIIIYEDQSMPHVDVLKSEVLRRIFLSLQKECQRLNVETLIETPPPGSLAAPLIVKNRTVQGVFLLGRYSPQTVEMLGDTPALAVSSYIKCPGLPRIVADNFHGMREATEHLLGLGHRQILFLGDIQPHTEIFRERSYGYMAAMHSRGLVPSVVFFDGRKQPVPIEEISRHTAVVCSNDTLAYRVQGALMAAGWKLPEACSIVSFDNLTDMEREQPITSYAPNWELMGRVAADLLLSQPLDIRGQDIVITVAGQLLLRDSTRSPAPQAVRPV